jgi:type II secretory pathway component PulF
MSSFRYQALAADGSPVTGVIDAEDRRSALQLLGKRGLYPSRLEAQSPTGVPAPSQRPAQAGPGPTVREGRSSPGIPPAASIPAGSGQATGGFRWGTGIKTREITAFSRQMAALVGASIPIPQALEGLGEEEVNPALREVVHQLSTAVRTGSSFSAALAMHPRLFDKLYVSMVRVGEEAGALPAVIHDLADLLEHEDEVRSEVVSAVAYPLFVLGFGLVTVAVLLVVVLPRLFSMLKEMTAVLPLPTRLLLWLSEFLGQYGWLLLIVLGAAVAGYRSFARTPGGALQMDRWKLEVPMVGSMLRAAALSRFCRTLGILVKSGVSLLPALKIVEGSMGNLILSGQIAQVAEATRGGASLAAPLRQMELFPRSVVQMIAVGEETGKLDEMLLKVAAIEERRMRARTKTIISLLAPFLILVVGALVGFMVIALLLPIFKMSQTIH